MYTRSCLQPHTHPHTAHTTHTTRTPFTHPYTSHTTHTTRTPYTHPTHRELYAKLKKDCLCNYEFVHAKLSLSLRDGTVALRGDFEMALRAASGDLDLRLLSDTLRISDHVLKDDPDQLASQASHAHRDVTTAAIVDLVTS